MDKDFYNIDKGNDDLQDNWLAENLNYTTIEPPLGFTQKVMEQIKVKPNPLKGSPLFWIIAVVPGAIILWLILFTAGTLNTRYQFNFSFIPDVSNIVSLYTLSKYVLMVTFGGLFFIGLDYFISKQLPHRQSYFSFLLV